MKRRQWMNPKLKTALITGLGAVGGFAFYALIGCKAS
jgi:hypothetical protein